MNRREFLQSAAVTGAALAAQAIARGAEPEGSTRSTGHVPRRPYGKDKVMISVIGFPGIGLKDKPSEEASSIVAAAIERGVNYFDVAPTYGNAQYVLGPALQPYRRNCFLACKTTQ